MADIVPYLIGMRLGRTFDVRNNSSGLDIFSEESTSNPKTSETTSTSITYKVIKSSEDVKHFLNISGDMSLRIKAGFIEVEGMGNYLKDDKSEENSLEILAKAQVKTVTETLTSSPPIENVRRNNIGTHYVRSIIYGGELFVRISIKGSDCENLKKIQETVEGNINLGGVLALEAKQSFKKMEEELRSSSEINIGYYCTGLGGVVPRDIDAMFKALEDFPNQMKEINSGKGVPLSCELVPLTHLDPDAPKLSPKKVSLNQLKQLEDQYDDITIAKKILNCFLQDDVNCTQEQAKKADEIDRQLEDTLLFFNSVISELDLTSGKECEALMKSAFDIYRKNKTYGCFRVEVKRFISQLSHQKKQISCQTLKKFPEGPSLNIVLLGKTGHGKSATGNSIFGEEKFHDVTSTSSTTHKCRIERGEVGGRWINLVDTPGTMDTKNVRLSMDEIGTAIAFCSDGYHAFLLILRIDVRMTEEEWMAIKLLKQMFGKHILDYTVLVFTHGDHFFKNRKRTANNILEYIQQQENDIKKLVKDCKNRCCLINNWEVDSGILREQVIDIIDLIDRVIAHNDGKMYTDDLFKFAQTELKKERQDQEQRESLIRNLQQTELDELKRGKDSKPKEEAEKDEKKVHDKIKGLTEQLNEEKEGVEEKVGQKVAQKAMDSDRGCFPPDALIRLQDGRLIQLADLRVGEKVLSFLSRGKLEYSEVYFFAHLDSKNSSQYIIISTSDHKLKLTPDHHMYIVDIGGYRYTVPARKIKIGDRILILDEGMHSFKEEVVTNLSASIEVGIYAPITMSGTIIVDNVLASCYVDIVPPKFSHPLLWPLRQLYRMSPSLLARVNTLGKEGIPAWIKFIMNNLFRWRK